MIIASMINLFFVIPLFMLSPEFSVTESAAFLPEQQATSSITTTQPITATKATTAVQITTGSDLVQMPPDRAEFYRRVAARSVGEGSAAVPEIACTIKNRLRVSRASLTIVLHAYYARDKTPRPEHIEMVRKVFEGELPCPETWWYALSRADTRRFRPHPHPALVVSRNAGEVWIYDH
ncbi:MAG: hypothetical protein NT075_01425 [Chloroflexi bacterium]|nr:hypothetical protein [Chloroflexota bacterium]